MLSAILLDDVPASASQHEPSDDEGKPNPIIDATDKVIGKAASVTVFMLSLGSNTYTHINKRTFHTYPPACVSVFCLRCATWMYKCTY